MKRKTIDVPKQIRLNPSVLNEVVQLVTSIQNGNSRVKRTKVSELLVPFLLQETLDRHLHLNIPFDILKRIFLAMEDPRLVWVHARRLNRKFRDWCDSLMDRYTISWELPSGPFHCQRRRDYPRWKSDPGHVLIFERDMNLTFRRFKDGKSHFEVLKNGKGMYSSNYWDMFRITQDPCYRYGMTLPEIVTLRLDPTVQIHWKTKGGQHRDTNSAGTQCKFVRMYVHL